MYLKILSDLFGLELAEGQPNASGIRRLRLIPSDQVLQLMPPDYYPSPEQVGMDPLTINGQSLILADGAKFIECGVVPDYASFSEDQDRERNGEIYRPQIQIIVPKDRPDITLWCHRYRGVRWIAIIQDRNGYNRLVGSPGQPLTLKVSNSLGAGQNGRNGRTLTFTGQSKTPAFYLSSIEDAELLYQGQFDISFGFAYNS